MLIHICSTINASSYYIGLRENLAKCIPLVTIIAQLTQIMYNMSVLLITDVSKIKDSLC